MRANLLKMKHEDLGRLSGDDALEVTNPEQVRLLTDPVSKSYFKPFLGQALSVSEAADVSGCSLSTMLYRVRTFLDAGLLEITRTQKRKGRPIKVYRAVANAFFIPFVATDFTDLEERYRKQLMPITNAVARGLATAHRSSPKRGEFIFRDESDTVWTVPTAMTKGEVVSQEGLVATLRDIVLNLSIEEAEALFGKLEQLFEEVYERGSNPSGRPYVLQVALVPFVEECD